MLEGLEFYIIITYIFISLGIELVFTLESLGSFLKKNKLSQLVALYLETNVLCTVSK